jgi:thiol-disulfide isomerase/thioredoxin
LSLANDAFDLEAVGILRRVKGENTSKAAQDQATYALAKLLTLRSEWSTALSDPKYAQHAADLRKAFGRAAVDDLKQGDSTAQKAEAEKLFQSVSEDADLGATKITSGDREISLGELAKRELFERRELLPGKLAPETVGEDLDGKPIRLSDFRGRVVVLTFWASWSASCMALVPHERELVERLRYKPFVLIGVNGDETNEAAEKAAATARITWLSVRDGGPIGPISQAWNVHGWPTFYLIDHRGMIVNKIGLSDADERLIDRTVKQAESPPNP